MTRIAQLSTLLAATALASTASAQIRLNEIHLNTMGVDTMEFVEIKGPPLTPLVGHMVCIVEGDGAPQGTLDRAYDLSASVIPASGLFVLGTATLVPAPNQVLPLASDNIENGTATFYLISTPAVAGITALVATDIRTTPGSGLTTRLATDGTLMVTILDIVGSADGGFPATDAVFDGAVPIGPDYAPFATSAPPGLLRCCDAPNPFSTTEFLDVPVIPVPPHVTATPGASNLTCAIPPPVAYCFGDGTGTACPCLPPLPPGDPDKGCPNSFNAGGGKLAASGIACISNDSLVLTCTTINNGGAVIFQGTNDNGGGAGMAFGDGLRCAAGNVRRMKSHAVTTNTHQYPDPSFGDNAISIRGAVLVAGDRWYQGWYRSGLAHCDPAANYNLTNGLKITWVP